MIVGQRAASIRERRPIALADAPWPITLGGQMAETSGSGEIRKADDIGRGEGLSPRHVVALVLVGLLVLLAILNFDDVSVDLLFGSVTMPLFVLIVVTAVIAFFAGWLVRGRREKRERDRND
jgi:uncharacterized integral membrane protein